MTSQFIEEFSFLLDSGRDGIEVSYNAAGVLAHIASDGPEVWTMMMMMMMMIMMMMMMMIMIMIMMMILTGVDHPRPGEGARPREAGAGGEQVRVRG